MVISITKTIKFLNLFALLYLSAAGGISGQQPSGQNQSLSGVELKGKVPVNRETLKVSLPKAQEATLSNGLRVFLIENHKSPSFTMQMVVLSGGISDASDKRGQALLTASLLREGTMTRASREIAEQIDALGSVLGSSSGASTITSNIASTGLIENFDKTLAIFADVILHPKFASEEIEKFKTRLLTQIPLQRSNPTFLARQQLGKVVYGDYPASSALPPEASVKNLTADDLKSFYSTYYRPNNAFLAVLGDVSMKELLPKLEKAFGEWKKADVPGVSFPSLQGAAKTQIYLIDRPGSVQTSLLLGNLGITRVNPDYYALQVMNEILGAGASSRLFINLREEKGYTYGAYSAFDGSKFSGLMTAGADVRTEVTEGALKEFLYEIRRIGEEKVSANELSEAKRSITGSFAVSLDSQPSLLANVVQQQIYNLPANYWDEYPQKIAAITAEDVQRVAQKYFDSAALQIVAVGDAAKIRPALEKFGNVQIVEVK